jgi:dTDP-4-amino-4,6-dideoxygalactose transaminase
MDVQEKVVEKLKEMTGCKHVFLLDRGNSAIFTAMYVVKTKNMTLAIPDQGGWLTYKDYPPKLDLHFMEYPTDYAKVTEESFVNAKNKAYLVCQPGGYFVQQELGMIRQKAEFLILDVSGSIGNDDVKNSRADIVVGSFGRWKPINLGKGGFFATNSDEIVDIAKLIMGQRKFKPDASEAEMLLRLLDRVKDRYSMFEEHCQKIKQDMKEFEILHMDSHGINVVIKTDNLHDKDQVMQYCDENNYEFTQLPRYIRADCEGVSIEVKRLE